MSEKLTRNRKSKIEQYKKERLEIIRDLNSIIGFQEDKSINSIMLFELEENEELKKRLKELSEKEIKKYWCYGKWGFYGTPERGRDNLIGLLKSLYSNTGYSFSGKNKTKDHNGVKKQYTQIIFIKNEQ